MTARFRTLNALDLPRWTKRSAQPFTRQHAEELGLTDALRGGARAHLLYELTANDECDGHRVRVMVIYSAGITHNLRGLNFTLSFAGPEYPE